MFGVETVSSLEIDRAIEWSHWPKISNVKVHFTVPSDGVDSLKKSIARIAKRPTKTVGKKQEFKQHHNFIVFRGRFVYNIYKESGTINVSGIPCEDDISSAITEFCNVFDINNNFVDLNDVTVDNITASGNFNRSINLHALKEIGNNKHSESIIASIASNTCYFPAAFCRTKTKEDKGIGTCIVFSSGKYCVVGATCRANIQAVVMGVAALIWKL